MTVVTDDRHEWLDQSWPMTEPEIQIFEQPKQRGIRFYYKCEGVPKYIPGETSSVNNRTYPSILIHNYRGKGRVRVTLVTKNEPYRPHPYYLVGKDCKDGYYEAEFGPECRGILFQLSVHCVMKKYVKDAIMQMMARGINPFNVPREQLLQTEEYDLKVVRLCIQVFLPDDSGHCTRPLSPIITNPIYNKRWDKDGSTPSTLVLHPPSSVLPDAFKEKEQNKTEVPSVNSSPEEEEEEEDVDSDEVYLRSCCENCKHVQQSYGNERIIPEKLFPGCWQAQLEGEGEFECAFTGLIFESMEPVLLRYSILSWSKFGNSLRDPWRIAGPIFDIQTVNNDATALKSIQLPHFLCLAAPENEIVFGVLHIAGDEHSDIERVTFSGSHLKWKVSSLSPVGGVFQSTQLVEPQLSPAIASITQNQTTLVEYHGEVLVYEDLCSSDNNHMFRIYLTIKNTSHKEDIKRELRRSKRRLIMVEKPRSCVLAERKYHLTSEPRGDITPEDLPFPQAATDFFEAFYEAQSPPFRLYLKASGADVIAWSAPIRQDDLAGSTEKNPSKRKMSRKQSCDASGEGISSKRCFSINEPGGGPSQPNMPMTPSQEVEKLKTMRSEFIKRVTEPVLNRLMDNLLGENVLNDEEMTSIRSEKYREEKARHFIDMVKKKGNKGCSKTIDALYQEDPTLYEELGLSRPLFRP